MKVTDIPGKKRGRYIPKYYVFRGFHLSTYRTQAAPLILIDSSGIRLRHDLEKIAEAFATAQYQAGPPHTRQ